ncbi:MAG: protease pro-enzyme activation domain-containing protein [Limisphaerales bacterium]
MQDRLKLVVVCLLSFLAASVQAAERQVLRGHVPAAVARLQPARLLPATNRLQLAIGLALHNPEGLTNLLRQLYDPANGSFRHYLTPEQFTEAFGPTEAEYQAVIGFAKANGLAVTGTHPNRMLVDVAGAVADVERAFAVKLRLYPHPQEARNFFAPDTEPSVDKGLRVLHISGLDNYTLPHPMIRRPPTGPRSGAIPRTGTAPDGSGAYFGRDFRNAYLPGVSLTGAGQTVGLLEFDGYYKQDIATYETKAGMSTGPQLVIVPVDGFNEQPGSGNDEVALDIEMAVSMAPGLSQVRIYEASPYATTANMDDMLNLMATDNLAKQISCGWGFDIDTTSQQIFQEFAAQGQSFFVASGDSGAYGSFVDQPGDNPFLTVVGGTSLTTSSSHTWESETAWIYSGGGISSIYPIPDWQQGIGMSLNHGSTTMRNVPDVALVADNVYFVSNDGQGAETGGTSFATPLWAAFTALVNEQAKAEGKPPVGFLNPALYAVGKGANYAECFHDIMTGDNTSTNNPDLFFAVPGYDLCTGWGTLNGGTSLIGALLAPPTEPLLITPPLGFYSQGPVGGPFSVTAQTYTLTNLGTASLNWSLNNTASWLHVSPASGTLAPGGPAATVTVSLNSTDSDLLIISYTGTVSFKNLNDGVGQDRQFTLLVGNGGFETGDFTHWSFSGDTNNNFVDSVDYTDFDGGSTIAGVNDSLFTHSGIYGAFLGQYGPPPLASLSQTLPTTAGQRYLLSFWLDNPAIGTPNEFLASWNGTTLFEALNAGAFAWTNIEFVVSATGTSSAIEFVFRNDQNAFGLDDVSVQPLPAPALEPPTLANGVISLTWSTVPGASYQVQYTENLTTAIWHNLGSALPATSGTLSAFDSSAPSPSSPQRFYRIVLE